MGKTTTLPIIKDADVILARAAGREIARDLGFSAADQTRLATAISELTRNVLCHAGTGECSITGDSDFHLAVVGVVVDDTGPSIPDVDLAMQDGFSTGGSLGGGLPGTRRLVHDFSIESSPDGTRVAIAMVRRKTEAPPPAVAYA